MMLLSAPRWRAVLLLVLLLWASLYSAPPATTRTGQDRLAVKTGHGVASLGPSVSLHFLKAILAQCSRLGIALPASASSWLSLHPAATRVPMDVQDSIWQEFCTHCPDPLLGLRLGLDTQPGNLDIVGLLLMSCDTLGEALEMLIEYQQIIGEGGEFFLERERSEWSLHYLARFNCHARERTEAVFSTLLHLGRWISGNAFSPSLLQFQQRAGAAVAEYQTLLACPLEFEARENALRFPAAQAALPLIQSNAAVTRHLRVMADAMLAGLSQQSLSHQVQALLLKNPAATKDEIAAQLHMSGRHLNRLLAEDGTSFKLLQDMLRRQQAEMALRTPERRMSDIAEQLGFSDESAFAKAFRRWTGQSPSQFRDAE